MLKIKNWIEHCLEKYIPALKSSTSQKSTEDLMHDFQQRLGEGFTVCNNDGGWLVAYSGMQESFTFDVNSREGKIESCAKSNFLKGSN